MTALKRAFLFFLLIFIFTLKVASIATTEAKALLKWKNSLSLSPSLNSWSLDNITNLCRWTGVLCNNGGSVSEINLSNANLAGSLDQLHFNSFPNLTRFDLSGNGFNGVIPAAIGNLSRLTVLDLSGNMFGEAIPPEIGDLKDIRYISLVHNYITGEIPYHIGNLQKVRYLDFGSNHLETPDWSRFPSFPLLKHLGFCCNELIMGFPDFIASCRNLDYLDWSLNQLTGQIPESLFSNLVKLEYLNLTANEFQGPLSLNLTKLSKLKDLRLASNYFSGYIPDSISLFSNLQILELFDNSFEGDIPPSLGHLRNLQRLALGMNRLNSSIPPELGLCTSLTNLSLAMISRTGPMPLSLSNLTNLSELRMSHNCLSGDISPHLFQNWTKLTSLQLQNNHFSCEVPHGIGLLTNLNLLFLYNNSFSGSIPSSLGKLTSLEILNLSHNNLSGKIPSALSGMINLKDFDFSYNMLSGPIPTADMLSRAPAKALAGNPGQCGAAEELPPCDVRIKRTVILIEAIVPTVSLIILVTLIAGCLTLGRKTKKYDEETSQRVKDLGEELIWKIEGKLSFGEIVRATEDFSEKYRIGRGGLGNV